MAATMHSAPISAPSMITAFMPMSAFLPMRQPWSTAPWPMWPSSSTTVSVLGKPCMTQVSWRLAPARSSSRPKSPRKEAAGPT